MNILSCTFWGEGNSDIRFLPPLIERVIDILLRGCARSEWEVTEISVLKPKGDGFVEQVLDLAEQSHGFTLMFVHTDADAQTIYDKAMPNKIQPALDKLEQTSSKTHCKVLVPVIPASKVENWKLGDADALKEVIGVELTEQEMALNISPSVLDGKAQSKEMLKHILNTAKQKSRNAPDDAADIDASLAQKISIDKLLRLESFRLFYERLKEALSNQNIIEENCP